VPALAVPALAVSVLAFSVLVLAATVFSATAVSAAAGARVRPAVDRADFPSAGDCRFCATRSPVELPWSPVSG
jgi:hypothetical protein